MSDPSLEEDSLISQDDIDKLLESSTIEEAEEKFSGRDSDAVDNLGELSQDDIDQLMNSKITPPAEPGGEDGVEEFDMELISQEDIDQLMNASVDSDEDLTKTSVDVEVLPDDELGELSQDDIDQLMNTSSSEKSSGPVSSDQDEDEDFEMISQDDINKLMGGLAKETAVEDDTVEKNEADFLPREDQGGDPSDEVLEGTGKMTPAPEDTPREDDHVIDASEAVDVQDSLITQETLDALIENFDTDADDDLVILDDLPVTDPDGQPDPWSEPAVQSDAADLSADLEFDEPADFLTSKSDAVGLDFDDEGNQDVSQDDIDALLLESDDDEDGEDDILISQDDIDTLLMAADQEDEDILGDLMDDTFDDGMDDDVEDEDALESDGFDEDLHEGEDQVVLEGNDEEPEVPPGEGNTTAGPQWARSRLVIACASALVVLGITIPLAYFLFFSGTPGDAVRQDPVARLAVEASREIEVETVDITIKTPVVDKKPGNILLKDFVILTSDLSKEMAYVTADISIDYSDQRAYHEIQNNLSFYRDLIYDSLNKSLVSEKREDITEADILWGVETTLKKVLPGQYIDRVSFKSFKAS